MTLSPWNISRVLLQCSLDQLLWPFCSKGLRRDHLPLFLPSDTLTKAWCLHVFLGDVGGLKGPRIVWNIWICHWDLQNLLVEIDFPFFDPMYGNGLPHNKWWFDTGKPFKWIQRAFHFVMLLQISVVWDWAYSHGGWCLGESKAMQGLQGNTVTPCQVLSWNNFGISRGFQRNIFLTTMFKVGLPWLFRKVAHDFFFSKWWTPLKSKGEFFIFLIANMRKPFIIQVWIRNVLKKLIRPELWSTARDRCCVPCCFVMQADGTLMNYQV